MGVLPASPERALARRLVVLGLALPLAACGGDAAAAERGFPDAAAPLPVVVVVVDTLRADHVGCYGYPRDTTPNVDALARDGVLFERCLAQSTWTKPTVATIHTGLLPSRHGVNQAASVVEPELVTLAERLRDAGYRTGAFGYNPHVFADGFGYDQGFEVFEEVPPPSGASDTFERAPDAEHVIDRALAWLDGIGDEPFLLYVHLLDAHMPYGPPEPYASRFESIPRPSGLDLYPRVTRKEPLAPDELQMLVDLYDAEIAHADAEIGRLLRALDARRAAGMRAPLFLFLSDHGEELYDHGDVGHNEAQMFDEVVHVPLVLSAPGLPAAWRGARVDALVQQIDVVPTVLEAAGLDPAPELPGTSLLEPLRATTSADPIALIETHDRHLYRKAVVLDGRKYVRTWSPAAREELYDLRADPGERADLLAADPAAAAAHRDALRRHLDASPGRYTLLVENQGVEPLKVTGFLYTREVQLVSGTWRGCEDGVDGPYELIEHELDGRPVYAFRFTLDLPPGDRDRLVFLPHQLERSFGVTFAANGEIGDPRRVALGESGRAPESMPFEIDLKDRAALSAAGPAFGATPAGPYRVAVYRNLDAVALEGTLSDENRRALDALGYGGR